MRMGEVLKMSRPQRRLVANTQPRAKRPDGEPVNGKATQHLPSLVHLATTEQERCSVYADVMMALDHAMPGGDGLAPVLVEYAARRGRSEIQERDALVRVAAWAMREAIALDREIMRRRVA